MSKKRGNARARTRAPTRTTKPPPGDSVHQSARQAVEAARRCGIAFIRKVLKKRSHRDPPNGKVETHFQAWVASGGFVAFANGEMLEWMREMESGYGKPSREWSAEERREAYDCVARWFHLLSESCERPKGRPRKKKKIADAMLTGMRERGKLEKKRLQEKLKESKSRYFAYERGAKLGAFAKNEGFRTLEDALEYVKQYDEWNEVMKKRVPPGVFRPFLEDEGIPAEKEAVARMHMSRARHQKQRS